MFGYSSIHKMPVWLPYFILRIAIMNTTYTINRLWYAHLLIVSLGCSADKLDWLHGFTPLGLTSARNHRSVINLLQKGLPVVIWILNEILSIYYTLEYIFLRRFLGMRNEVSGITSSGHSDGYLWTNRWITLKPSHCFVKNWLICWFMSSIYPCFLFSNLSKLTLNSFNIQVKLLKLLLSNWIFSLSTLEMMIANICSMLLKCLQLLHLPRNLTSFVVQVLFESCFFPSHTWELLLKLILGTPLFITGFKEASNWSSVRTDGLLHIFGNHLSFINLSLTGWNAALKLLKVLCF